MTLTPHDPASMSRDDTPSGYPAVPTDPLSVPATGGHSPTLPESLHEASNVASSRIHTGSVTISPTDSFHFYWTHSDDDAINKWKIHELYHLTEIGRATFTTNCLHMIGVIFTTGWFHTLRVMIESVIEARWKDAHGIKH